MGGACGDPVAVAAGVAARRWRTALVTVVASMWNGVGHTVWTGVSHRRPDALASGVAHGQHAARQADLTARGACAGAGTAGPGWAVCRRGAA